MIEVVGQLNRILKDRNMTQNDLSNLTGITQPVISRFDKNGQYRINHLFLIAKALELNIEDLFRVADYYADPIIEQGHYYIAEDGTRYIMDKKTNELIKNNNSLLKNKENAFETFYPISHEDEPSTLIKTLTSLDASATIYNQDNRDELDARVNAHDKKKD